MARSTRRRTERSFLTAFIGLVVKEPRMLRAVRRDFTKSASKRREHVPNQLQKISALCNAAHCAYPKISVNMENVVIERNS